VRNQPIPLTVWLVAGLSIAAGSEDSSSEIEGSVSWFGQAPAVLLPLSTCNAQPKGQAPQKKQDKIYEPVTCFGPFPRTLRKRN